MMKNIVVFLLLAILIACNNKAKTNSQDTATVDTQDAVITNDGVGKFLLGMPIPQSLTGYDILKQTRIVEEGSEEPHYIVSQNGKEILKLIPEYDSDKFTDNIDEIVIVSDKFKTTEKIGVNSTIEEFKEKYPDFEIWYTYISDAYIIETKKYNIQFLLDAKGFIGKHIITGDMEKLKVSDFAKGCKITGIRIFKI